MIRFVCDACKLGEHCSRNDSWCDCQHRTIAEGHAT